MIIHDEQIDRQTAHDEERAADSVSRQVRARIGRMTASEQYANAMECRRGIWSLHAPSELSEAERIRWVENKVAERREEDLSDAMARALHYANEHRAPDIEAWDYVEQLRRRMKAETHLGGIAQERTALIVRVSQKCWQVVNIEDALRLILKAERRILAGEAAAG